MVNDLQDIALKVFLSFFRQQIQLGISLVPRQQNSKADFSAR